MSNLLVEKKYSRSITMSESCNKGTQQFILGPEVRLLRDTAVLLLGALAECARAALGYVLPPPPKHLIGEVVLVTGAAHGVGRELALQFARLGAIVVCWDIDDIGNDATAQAILKKNGRAHAYTVDVSDPEDVAMAAVDVLREVGPVTVLVNNAAVLRYESLLMHDPADVQRHFGVNVLAHFWTLKAFLPHMLQRGRGHVVAVSSMNGLVGSASKTAYCSSKFAVRGLAEALREELRRSPQGRDIRVTVVYPFWVDTGFARDPHYRWSWLFGAVPAAEAARRVVAAVRRDVPELSIPRPLLWAHALHRLFPRRVYELFVDYWEGGACSEKQPDGKILALPDIEGNSDEIKSTVFGVSNSY